MIRTLNLFSLLFAIIFLTCTENPVEDAPPRTEEPLRYIFNYNEMEREYFVWLPTDYRQDHMYWALFVAHGGGSNGKTFWLASDLRCAADEIDLKVIIISPSFLKDDPNNERFPVLGEGDFLKSVIEDAKTRYRLKSKILLTGYSRGAQFSHRFALQNPDLVQACAPLAAGAWTTPDGRFLMYTLGEIPDPKSFLSLPENGEGLKASQKNLFDPRVAKVAGQSATSGAKEIPFLVMCGTLDERFEIAQAFYQSLKEQGYIVETAWPETKHGGRKKDTYRGEFDKGLLQLSEKTPGP